jgi:acyl carrier protein
MGVDKKLIDVFCKKFGEDYREDITLETAMNDIPEWNSFSFIELMMEIEEVFGVSFDDDEIVEMFSVAAIQTTLSNKTK